MHTRDFEILNIDCVNCATKIEKALSDRKDLQSARINFASGTLQVKTAETVNLHERLETTIKSLEPEVEILPKFVEPQSGSGLTKENALDWKTGKLGLLILAAVIYFLGLIFEEQLFSLAQGIPAYVGFGLLYALSGWTVLKRAGRNIISGQVFDENFLMTIATIGAFFINAIPEAVGVMLFYRFGEYFEELALTRSRRSITSLLSLRPDLAHKLSGVETQDVHPSQLKPGDRILIRPGERVPIDGVLEKEATFVDTSAITGESLPRSLEVGDEILSGFIVQTTAVVVEVTKNFENSSINRILYLVEEAVNNKAPTEKFITKFARYYTPVVVFLALGLAFIPPFLFNLGSFSEWLYKALVLLVVSCPCALVISIPLSYFGGIGAASREGILIKGSNHIDSLTKIRTLIFDKTGTLTQGKLKLSRIAARNGFSQDQVLDYAAHGEFHSNHPLAHAIKSSYGPEKIDQRRIKSHKNHAGYGVEVLIDDHKVLLGNGKFLLREGISLEDDESSETLVYLAIDGLYAGYISVRDVLREDAVSTIQDLKQQGLKEIVMLTGDNTRVASDIAGSLGIDHYEAELLPEEKLVYTQKLLDQGSVAVVGDGINDAAMIAQAHVGFAMGGIGSDLAIESADIVLMGDRLSSISKAISLSKKTKVLVWQNIIFALGVKLLIMILGAVGISGLWEAIFADVGVTLLAVLNSLRILKRRD